MHGSIRARFCRGETALGAPQCQGTRWLPAGQGAMPGQEGTDGQSSPGEEATQSCPAMTLQWYVLSHPFIPLCGDDLVAGRVRPHWQSSKELWKKAHRLQKTSKPLTEVAACPCRSLKISLCFLGDRETAAICASVGKTEFPSSPEN